MSVQMATIPGYLGRVMLGDSLLGTCFQVSPGILITAWHVILAGGASSIGDKVSIEPLAGGIPFDADVAWTDALHDLALLKSLRPLPSSVSVIVESDNVTFDEHMIITGAVEVQDPGHAYRYLEAAARWRGQAVRDQEVYLARIESSGILRGMSGAPIRRQVDDAVVGIISGRYNSADGWLRDSAWVARTEHLRVPLAGSVILRSSRQPQSISSDELMRHCNALASRYSAWSDRHYIPSLAKILGSPESVPVEMDLLGAQHERFALLGPSGSGKSTLLQRMAWEKSNRIITGETSARLPIIVPILKYSGDLMFTIRSALNSFRVLNLTNQKAEEFLANVDTQIMFDGLNEAPGPRRDTIIADICSLMDAFNRPHYVITCRDNDPIWESIPAASLDGVFALEPLTPERIVSYLSRHLGSRIGRLAYAELPTKLKEILASPLLLWMFKEQVVRLTASESTNEEVAIVEASERLARLTPRNRAEMYQNFTSFMLARENQKGGSGATTRRDLERSALIDLALTMQQRRQLTSRRRPAVAQVRETVKAEGYDEPPSVVLHRLALAGLLAVEDHVRFTHQSFQEFFAALALGRDRNLGDVQSLAVDVWWEDCLVFYAGMAPQDILASFLTYVADANIDLAFRCLTETNTTDPRLRGEVRRRLLSLLQAQGWVERRKAVELLGLMEDITAVPEIAAMLDDPNEEVRWQAASMLRGYKTHHSIARLRAALTDSAWAVRARAAEALGRLGAIEAAADFAPLLQSNMPRERCDAAYSLYLMNIERGAPEVGALMCARGSVSDSVMFVLEVLESEDPSDYIVAQLNSANSNRREKAAYFVSRREIAEALEDLAYLLDDPVDDVVIVAMQSIAELNGIEYLHSIQSQTTHPTPFVRVIAALCCQLLGAKSAIPSLRGLLADEDSEVRYATVRSLGALGASAEADRMAKLLSDPVEKVRWQAAFALGRVGNESALELLERAGRDPSTDVALAAAAAARDIRRRLNL